jgi:hypothetical protein
MIRLATLALLLALTLSGCKASWFCGSCSERTVEGK